MFIRVKAKTSIKEPNLFRKSVQIVESFREMGKVKQKIVKHVGVAHSEEQLAELRVLAQSMQIHLENENDILELPLKQVCYYPFYMILIDYDGEVLLCPHDWNKTLKFGNLKQKTFFDIWNGKALNGIRKRLSNSDRNFGACKNCDVLGTIIGKDSFEAWDIKK